MVEKAAAIIEAQLHKMYKRTAINSAITFAINISGILLVILRPFGERLSEIFAFSLFGIALAISLVRFILFSKKNGKMVLGITKETITQKSFYKGAENYIVNQFPLVSKIYAGIELGEEYVPSLALVPRIETLTRTFVSLFRRQFIIYGIILSVYTVAFFWVVKPIILMKYL